MVRPTETLARDRLKPNERQKMVLSTITLLNTIYRQNIKSTCITYCTYYYQRLTLEGWFTNLEQIPLNRSQQLPAPYKLQKNDWTTDNLTDNKRLLNCDNRRIQTHHSLQRVFIANNIRLNWQMVNDIAT